MTSRTPANPISGLCPKRVLFSVLILLLQSLFNFSIASAPEKTGKWDDVTGFTISQQEDYMVLSRVYLGREQLFETRYENGRWTDLLALNNINDFLGASGNIGGPALNHTATKLYFHADYPGGRGGYDIYVSTRTPDGWSPPQTLDNRVNSEADELFPFMNPGDSKFFFSRPNFSQHINKPRRAPDCQLLFVNHRDTSGSWENPEPLHDAINMGCEYRLSVALDGKSVYFSSVDQDNHKDGFNIYHAREIARGVWFLPVIISDIAEEVSLLNPQVAGNNIYYIRQTEGRRGNMAEIYKTKLPGDFQPLAVHRLSGKIQNLKDRSYIHTSLTVFNPTTLNVLGVYNTNPQTGEFVMPLLDRANYIVDVRSPGLSFASFQPDFREAEKQFGPELIELFEEVELLVSVYDGEIFRPLNASVRATPANDPGASINATGIEPGVFMLTLPIGKQYKIAATCAGFLHNAFDLSLKADVIFSRFYRDLPLEPVKLPVDLFVRDAETQEGVAADVRIANLHREEIQSFAPQTLDNGHLSTLLRDHDTYEISVRAEKGYAYWNQTMQIHSDNTMIYIDLTPLRAQTTIILQNIHFATNSAELTAESFNELDRVVELLQNNPNLIIEISAHTDNVGSDGFNMLLSDRRAQSVVNYLLDNDIPSRRLIAQGYGLREPLLPNTSDENRAKNRRVEFKIIEIETPAN